MSYGLFNCSCNITVELVTLPLQESSTVNAQKQQNKIELRFNETWEITTLNNGVNWKINGLLPLVDKNTNKNSAFTFIYKF